MLYPLTFQPDFKERVWGGRMLETLYKKPLPAERLIGESWEICDRPEGSSVIANGPLAGKDVHWLIEEHGRELYGAQPPSTPRFPLLVKILDAREMLSVQVHPPAEVARQLGSEPKTEMWYVAHADPEAKLYAGLKKGVTREEFQRKLQDGTVADCLHSLPIKVDDVLFVPSGRVHALGAGAVVFEIQQNSDSTYRVFDWNRPGLDGKPRELHIAESLASIDWADFEPQLIGSKYSRNPKLKVRYLLDDPLFHVDAFKVKRGERFHLRSTEVYIVAVLRGRLGISYQEYQVLLQAGQFALLPASLERTAFTADSQVEFLQVRLGSP